VHTPVMVGLPQIVLIGIACMGVVLLITMFTGSRVRGSGRYAYADEEEARKFGRQRQREYRRRIRPGRGIAGLVLLLVAISLLWVTFLVQSYLGLTGEIKVAHVRATALANAPHEMTVELSLYDSFGRQTSDNTYLLKGDEWMLQGDIVRFATWANVVGLHSGYKLTRLEGRYDDIALENSAPHTATSLNGGDDTFFKTAYTQKAWFAWFVDASYGNAVFQAPGSFDILATQDALVATPAP
jgi:hypothetical protein